MRRVSTNFGRKVPSDLLTGDAPVDEDEDEDDFRDSETGDRDPEAADEDVLRRRGEREAAKDRPRFFGLPVPSGFSPAAARRAPSALNLAAFGS